MVHIRVDEKLRAKHVPPWTAWVRLFPDAASALVRVAAEKACLRNQGSQHKAQLSYGRRM